MQSALLLIVVLASFQHFSSSLICHCGDPTAHALSQCTTPKGELLSQFRKVFLTWSLSCPKSSSFYVHLNGISAPTSPSPEPFLQWHCCSTTTEKFQFPSQPHPFFETTKEVEELYKSTYSRRTKHLATELTPKETPNTPSVRILNYRRLKITIRRCSKSFLQYQMDLAINSQTQVTTIF